MIQQNTLPCSSSAFAGLSREVLRMGKSIRFQARGVSMRPLVRDGDILLIEPLNSDSICLGDVILFGMQNERVVIHRVILRQEKNESKFYLVQGDQVAHPDGWIEEEQIYGRLTAVERHGKVINLATPLMKVLGKYTAVRSRFAFGNKKLPLLGTKAARKLPIIGNYLQ